MVEVAASKEEIFHSLNNFVVNFGPTKKIIYEELENYTTAMVVLFFLLKLESIEPIKHDCVTKKEYFL